MSPNLLASILARSVLWGALIALMLGFLMPPGDRHHPHTSPPTVWHTHTIRRDVRVPACIVSGRSTAVRVQHER
jgi:hypothetical protein